MVVNAKKASSFSEAMLSLTPPEKFDQALSAALGSVDNLLKQVFGNDAWALAFGSIVQGVHLDGSDLDLCFDVPGESSVLPIGPNGKPDNTRQVAALKRILNRARGGFRVIETRFWKHMKVPIIILGYRSKFGIEIETDISIGTEFEGVVKGLTDRVIRRALAASPFAMHLARLVKLWAKVEKLNKAYDGFLNSLGWTILVLFFCIERAQLDPSALLQEEPNEMGLHGDSSVLPPVMHDRDEEGTILPSDERALSLPTVTDVMDFFEWIATWESWWPQEPPPEDENGVAGNVWGVSIVDGMIVEVPKPANQWADSSVLFIEDPGIRIGKDKSENVARSLKVRTWAQATDRAGALAARLRRVIDSGVEADTAADVVNWMNTLLAGLGAEKPQAAPMVPPAGQKRPWSAVGGVVPPTTFRPGMAPGMLRPGMAPGMLRPGMAPAMQRPGMVMGGGGGFGAPWQRPAPAPTGQGWMGMGMGPGAKRGRFENAPGGFRQQW